MATTFTEKGMKATFLAAERGWPSIYRQLCTIVPSSSDQEKYPWLGAPPAMRQFVGPRQVKRLPDTTYSIVNLPWEATIGFRQEDLDDDKLGAQMMRVAQMAEYNGRHKDELVMQTLIDAAYDTDCIDGQYFFDTDHSWPEAVYTTSQSNDLTSNITTTTAPTNAEFQAALVSNVSALRGFKDSNGKPINPPGAKIWLEGSPNFEYIFNRFVNSNLLTLASTGAAEDNPWKGMLGGYILNPHTANTERFRTYVLDGSVKPFIFQEREKLRMQFIKAKDRNPDSYAFMNNESLFGTYARYNAGYGLWAKAVSHIFT